MSNDKTHQQSFVNIGSSSLLIIFLILCLVVFATLSLSGARSDYSFSERMAERKTSYYAASNTAEEILADIDAAAGSMTEAEFAEFAAGYDRAGITLDYEAPYLSYSVPTGDSQVLNVKLEMFLGDTAGATSHYRISEWATAADASWESDEHVTLISIE